MLLLILCYY